MPDISPNSKNSGVERVSGVTYWRVEGSLFEVSTLRSVGFFNWNSQSFLERWVRRGGMLGLALLRLPYYLISRTFATRALHSVLRGITRDRLDLLGEEYFQYELKPRMRREAVEKLVESVRKGERVVLVSQMLEHIVRPLTEFFAANGFVANRLEFRDGVATGRIRTPVIRPRGPFAWLASGAVNGRVPKEKLLRQLDLEKQPDLLDQAVVPALRPRIENESPVQLVSSTPRVSRLPVRETLAGKQLMLIGVTGFIGKVWLVDLLEKIPEIGKITLLIRRNRTTTAQRRFEKIVEESPAFDGLHDIHGGNLAAFLKEKVEVVEGDVSQPGLGLDSETQARVTRTLDLIVSSAGLTDFNPDLRDAISSNIDSTIHLVDFQKQCSHSALMHLSTCYVVGMRDGRVTEELYANYNPGDHPEFDSEKEIASLREMVRRIEERSESVDVTKALRRQALGRSGDASKVVADELDGVLRRNRARWVRNRLVRAGMKRAHHLGWPNTYTFTKSLGESILARQGQDLPIAIVRPSIVESSERTPFTGWNEGINTSGPLSYLLGTNFRQLPSNERKCLDVIPVDMVTRGMTLIAAALIQRQHARLYQLATSAINPVNMGRSIELTGLAHRKHYRAQQGIEHWLKVKLETIPVSKLRYERLSIPMQKAVVSRINKAASTLHISKPPLAKTERDLVRAEKLIDLYEPFILHNQHVFECENARLLSTVLPAEEKALFDFAPENIDWWDYWINIHIPALRRWCYPLMEGRPLEAREARVLDWSVPSEGASAATR
jgi:alcohol-forming fatty acyl-CoA reductase